MAWCVSFYSGTIPADFTICAIRDASFRLRARPYRFVALELRDLVRRVAQFAKDRQCVLAEHRRRQSERVALAIEGDRLAYGFDGAIARMRQLGDHARGFGAWMGRHVGKRIDRRARDAGIAQYR